MKHGRLLRVGFLLTVLDAACRRDGSHFSLNGREDSTGPRASQIVPASSSAPIASKKLKEGTFGLVNGAGDTIVTLAPAPEPSYLKTALCNSGTYPLTHIGPQAVGDSQRAGGGAEFASPPPELFRITGEPRSYEICYLAADSELVRSLIPLKGADPSVAGACPSAWVQALKATKHLAVTDCRPLAAGPANIRLIAAQFAPANDSILASLVLLDSARVFFRDFPAPYSEGEIDSRWRVDDQGIFHVEDLHILFLARRGAAWIMGLTWAGAEGDDAYLEVSDSSQTFRVISQTYRYWTQ